MRFWDFDVTGSKQPVFTLYGDHEKTDSLSAVCTTEDNDYIVTGDTSGCLKLWNFSDFIFKEDHTSDNIRVEWFIIAHKTIINSIQIVEGE
jgi:WD40 repeat protein